MPGILRKKATTASAAANKPPKGEKSPMGVKEIYKLQQQELKGSLQNKKTPASALQSPKKKSATKLSPNSPSISPATVKKNKVKPLPLFNQNGQDVRKELQRLKERLLLVQKQSDQDRDDLHQRMKEGKELIRKQLRAKYEPFLVPDKAADIRVKETAKIIQYLRDDNARIRDEIQYYGKMISEMKRRNQELEETNRKVGDTFDSLNDYVKGKEVTNAKLVKNSETYKEHIKIMKDKMKHRRDYWEAEANTADLYEEVIGKVISHIGNKCKDHDLIERIIEDADKGSKQAAAGKVEELKKTGIAEIPLTRRRISKQNRIIRSANKIDEESDSDSDSDSDKE